MASRRSSRSRKNSAASLAAIGDFDADDVIEIVIGRLAAFLLDPHRIAELASGESVAMVQSALTQAELAAANLRSGSVSDTLPLIGALVDRVQLHEDRVTINLAIPRLQTCLGLPISDEHQPLELSCKAVRVRRGHEVRLVIPSAAPVPAARMRDEKLVALVAEAIAAKVMVAEQPDKSLNAIAAEQKRCRTRLGKLVVLGHLAPEIVTAILEGRQPPTLTARSLMATPLPLEWSEQRRALGFA